MQSRKNDPDRACQGKVAQEPAERTKPQCDWLADRKGLKPANVTLAPPRSWAFRMRVVASYTTLIENDGRCDGDAPVQQIALLADKHFYFLRLITERRKSLDFECSQVV